MRRLRFETIGDPDCLTSRTLTGRLLELHERPCQARKRNGEMCGSPSRQWMLDVGTRCGRHFETHRCRVCAA